MKSDINRILYEENLRAEALQLADGFAPFPIPAEDQELKWDGGNVDDFTELLNQVQFRFPYDLDGAAAVGNATYTRLTDYFAVAGQLPRFYLYANVCLLFVGHPDLFRRFEQLYDWTSEGSRRQIREWRDCVRREFLCEINTVIGDCRSAIAALRQAAAGNLTGRNLGFIEKTCFAGHDADPSFKAGVMQILARDPMGSRHLFLPRLEDTQIRFLRMHHFVSNYFAQLSSPV